MLFLLPLVAGDLGGWVTTALGVLSLATVAGLGLQVGRIKDLRSQLSDTREDVRAGRERDEDRKAQITELKDQIAAQEKHIAKQDGDIELLKQVATGEVQWQVVADRLDDQGKALTVHHDKALHYWESAEEHWLSAEAKVDALIEYIKDTRGPE